jgi:hypothetical protein
MNERSRFTLYNFKLTRNRNKINQRSLKALSQYYNTLKFNNTEKNTTNTTINNTIIL